MKRIEEEVEVQEGLQALLDEIGKVRMFDHNELCHQITRFRLGRRELEKLARKAGLPLEKLVGWARRRAKGENPPWPWATLNREDRRALLTGIDGEAALLEIVEANLRLVAHIAKRYSNDSVPMEERISEGTFGLIRAVEMFDPRRGYRFSTYAFHWIRQAISRLLERRSSIFKVSSEDVRRYWKSLCSNGLEAATEPKTPAEDALEAAFNVLSLEYAMTEEGTTTLQDMIEGESSPVEETERQMLQDILLQELRALPSQEAALLSMTAGLAGPELTVREAGKALSLEPELAAWHYEHARVELKKALARREAIIFAQT